MSANRPASASAMPCLNSFGIQESSCSTTNLVTCARSARGRALNSLITSFALIFNAEDAKVGAEERAGGFSLRPLREPLRPLRLGNQGCVAVWLGPRLRSNLFQSPRRIAVLLDATHSDPIRHAQEQVGQGL